jgi:hypothetical protein
VSLFTNFSFRQQITYLAHLLPRRVEVLFKLAERMS